MNNQAEIDILFDALRKMEVEEDYMNAVLKKAKTTQVTMKVDAENMTISRATLRNLELYKGSIYIIK